QRDFSSANKKPLVVNTPVPIMLATTSAVALSKPSGRSRTLFVATFIDCPSEWRPLLNVAGGGGSEPLASVFCPGEFWGYFFAPLVPVMGTKRTGSTARCS